MLLNKSGADEIELYNKIIGELRNEGISRTLKRKLSEELGREVCSYPPMIFNLESTNMWGLDCKNCPRSSMKREVGFMDKSLFKDIVNQVADYDQNNIIWLHHFGDPLLHPEIADFANYANKNGIKTGISVTGNSLTESRAEELAQSNIDMIKFSFMGVGKEFEKIQKNADFENVKKNIEYFLSLNRGNTEIEGEILIGSNSKKQDFQEFASLWDETVNINMKETHDWLGESEEIKEVAENIENDESQSSQCWVPWHSISILWNGDVVPCCRDYDGFYVVGNLENDSLENIWNNERMKRLRRLHQEGRRNEIELCRGCKVSRMSIKEIISKIIP